MRVGIRSVIRQSLFQGPSFKKKTSAVTVGLIVVVQSLSHVQLFVTPWTAACQTSVLHYLLEFAQIYVH